MTLTVCESLSSCGESDSDIPSGTSLLGHPLWRRSLLHDDQKGIVRRTRSRDNDATLESERLFGGCRRFSDRLRVRGIRPPITLTLSYLLFGGPFGGRAACRYAYVRTVFECLLAVDVLDYPEKDRQHGRQHTAGEV